MIEVLLFSLSISIDAFGYSLSFGTRNLKITKKDFFVLDLLNSLILTLFLLSVSSFRTFIENNALNEIGAYLLLIIGIYYIITAFIEKFKKDDIHLKKENKYFGWKDLLLLFSVFIFENAFSSLIFITTLSYPYLFVVSNFVFHYLFFNIGFDLGNKIVKKYNDISSFLTGLIFVFLYLSS